MLRFEWKKLLYYRKGLVLIVVFLIAELLGTILLTGPYDKDLEENRTVYDRYLSQVEGPLTPEKRQWIEDEMLRLNTVNAKLEQLKTDYYRGDIPEDAFRASFDNLSAENADYPGFSKLYTQYIYVRESDRRCFLYTGGWEVLFGNQEPDYLFLLLLIFLISPVFCQEYGNQMDQILLTQRRSAKYQWQIKVALALVSASVLTAVLQMFELILCAVRYGLPHWDYSLQSLYSFGSVQKNMTLGQAFILQFFLKEIGYLYVATLILFISVLLQKYAFALMAGIVLLPVPFLTVNSNASLLLIPGPWALMIGSIYLNGEGIRLGSNGVVPVPEVTWAGLGLLIALSVLICIIMLLYIRHKNTNSHLRIRGHKTVAALLMVILLCTGCGGQKEDLCYNSKQSNSFESDRYILFTENLGSCYFVDKQTDTIRGFPLDAFQGETSKAIGTFYCEGTKVYYLKAQQQALTNNAESLAEYYTLVEIDFDTMQERVICQWNQSSKWFFGLLDKDSTEPFPFYVEGFFLHDGGLYYPNNGELFVMNLQNRRYESYLKLPNSGSNLAYDGENIYYTDQYNRLTIHNLRTGNTEALENVVARDYLRTPEGVYFLNIRDKNTLYFWDEETQTTNKLDDTEAFALYWDERYCWVDSMDGLFRMKHDGSSKTKVDCSGFVCSITYGTTLCMTDYETGVTYLVDKESLNQVKVIQ